MAQRFSARPVKFGSISAQTMTKMIANKHYGSEHELILDVADIVNAELREVAAAGCRVIQVEEPRHHIAAADGIPDKELQFLTDALNREIKGVETEVWLHTCWGNPSQQPIHWTRPSYERALPHLLQTTADVITLECASTDGRDLPLLAKYRTPERLILSSDCGFGREGLSRRIAFYKAVAINLGANIVRRELKLPEVDIPAADPRYTFSG